MHFAKHNSKMSTFLVKIVLFLVCIIFSTSETIEVICPEHCECDMFQNQRRATCINKKLVTLEAFIPNITQILDISCNQISELRDHIFYDENLLSLHLLNISHNKISEIHMGAFYGLHRLKTLDLSYNYMQYILPHWFWSLEVLEELYLKENTFKTLGDDPLFESRSLKVLDMSNCKISHLGPDVFIKIPNLESLDISENMLINLNTDLLSPMKNLSFLNVTGNPFRCDDFNLSKYCYKNEISFSDPCKYSKKSRGKVFEQIVMATTPVSVTIKKNSWLYDSNTESVRNITKIIEVCRNNTYKFKSKGLLMNTIELSPELSILIPFICGLLIGLIIGCTVQIGKPKINDTKPKESCFGRRRRNVLKASRKLKRRATFTSSLSLRGRRNIGEESLNLVTTASHFADSSPLFVRKFMPDVE